MDYSIDKALERVLLLARHAAQGDVSSAILLLLIDLDFQVHCDSFYILRNAIMVKYQNPGMQMADLYYELERICESGPSISTCEMAIRSCIQRAWDNRTVEKWAYFFPDDQEKRPSNKKFIAKIAIIMELWSKCTGGYHEGT